MREFLEKPRDVITSILNVLKSCTMLCYLIYHVTQTWITRIERSESIANIHEFNYQTRCMIMISINTSNSITIRYIRQLAL